MYLANTTALQNVVISDLYISYLLKKIKRLWESVYLLSLVCMPRQSRIDEPGALYQKAQRSLIKVRTWQYKGGHHFFLLIQLWTRRCVWLIMYSGIDNIWSKYDNSCIEYRIPSGVPGYSLRKSLMFCE